VTATRKQASFKPNELVMREILCIASAVMDETFLSDSSSFGLGGRRPNRLSLPLRLAFIAAVMIVTAFAFGSILAGLHALEGLF
jgi:hypothetical protein